MLYNGHRDYNPALGRYIQSDPIGLRGGINTYGYVRANPLIRWDMLGLADSIDDSIASAIVRGDVAALNDLIEAGGLTPAQEAAAQQGIRTIQILKNSTDSVGKMADMFGKSTRQIKRAIEVCKQQGMQRGGPIRNPDVVVDPLGNVYPKLPNGGIGDIIGNLHDHF